MKTYIQLAASAAIILLITAGCATSSTAGKREKGPDGTVAFQVAIECSDPGARVEANNEYVGTTPMDLTIFGDKDGTFHNFGRYEYVIKVYPVRQGQYLQTKVFKTGGWFTAEDRIPSRLYFDLNLTPTAPTQPIDLNIK